MTLALQRQMKKQDLQEEKYLKFLMDAYVALSSGYVTFSMNDLAGKYGVDKCSLRAAQDLGWISKLSGGRHTKYYWRGPVPERKMVDEVKRKISMIKNTSRYNILQKQPPVNSNGKPLIPIVSEKLTFTRKDSENRYLQFLKEVYSLCSEKPVSFSGNKLTVKHRISNAAFTMLKTSVLVHCFQEGKTKLYKWVGEEPTQRMAADFVDYVNESIKQYVNKPQIVKPLESNTVNSEKMTKPVSITHTLVSETQGKEELTKELAMKLLALGDVKRANEVLDNLLKKK